MKRHALIACLFLPLSCVGSHAPTAARAVIPPAEPVGTADIHAPRVRSKATAAWEMLSKKRSCMCAPQEGDNDWRMFLQAPSPETVGLLISRPGSARPTDTARLLNRPDLRRRSREDARNSILADATARGRIESRVSGLHATVSTSPSERDGKLAVEVLAEGGRR